MTGFLIFLIKTYKKFISPVAVGIMGDACRFTPTCSEYAINALERYGALKGTLLGIKRFSKCHPFGGSGYDPVPRTLKTQ